MWQVFNIKTNKYAYRPNGKDIAIYQRKHAAEKLAAYLNQSLPETTWIVIKDKYAGSE